MACEDRELIARRGVPQPRRAIFRDGDHTPACPRWRPPLTLDLSDESVYRIHGVLPIVFLHLHSMPSPLDWLPVEQCPRSVEPTPDNQQDGTNGRKDNDPKRR